jgi:preprotein translocase subunit SecE
MSGFDKMRTFLGEVKTESRKVSWPRYEELRESTLVVIVAVFVITVFISIVDLILNKGITFLMRVGT